MGISEQEFHYNDRTHEVETKGLPESEAEKVLDRELEKQEALEQIFGGNLKKGDAPEKGRADLHGKSQKGWKKIKTPKVKIQKDIEITRAQRKSAKNQ